MKRDNIEELLPTPAQISIEAVRGVVSPGQMPSAETRTRLTVEAETLERQRSAVLNKLQAAIQEAEANRTLVPDSWPRA